MPGHDHALHVLESYAGSAIRAGAPSDDALLHLLVRMAFADGRIEDAELSMLRHIVPLPDDGILRSWIEHVLASTPDFVALAAAFDTDDRRWLALRFAARMAGRDGHVADAERHLLEALAEELDLPPRALERVLHELRGPPPHLLEPDRLRAMVDDLGWDAAMSAEGPVASTDLIAVVPPGARPVLRIGVDHAEVLGLYTEGLAGRFLEGAAFLPWNEIVGCGRGEGLESSVRLFMADGRIFSLIDARLGAIRMLIDRLYRHLDAPAGARRPVIERVTAGASAAAAEPPVAPPASATFDGSEVDDPDGDTA